MTASKPPDEGTPRTDAAKWSENGYPAGEVVTASFARQLERELADKTLAYEGLLGIKDAAFTELQAERQRCEALISQRDAWQEVAVKKEKERMDAESRAASATALLRECRNALTTGYVNCRGDKCRQLNCTACFGDDAESYDALIARIDAASGEAG